jgi:TPR repeat protein
MYRNGFGVILDETLAFHFTLRAAELANDDECLASMGALADLMEQGWGSDQDQSEALEILKTSS